jgi:hypothetical protein
MDRRAALGAPASRLHQDHRTAPIKKADGSWLALTTLSTISGDQTVVRSRRARVRFLTPNGQETEMIRADQRHRFLVHFAFQAPHTRLVGGIWDG